MEKYKANHNSSEPVETKEKSGKEQKQEATSKALDAGLTIGLDAYTGGQFSKIKNGLSKVPGMGKAIDKEWNKNINRVSKVAAQTPIGDIAKGLNDSGVTDSVKSGYDMYTNAQNGNVNAKSSNSTTTNNNKSSSSNSFLTNNIMSFGLSKSFKIKLVISLSVFIFLLLMIVSVVSGKDFENLDLTNKSNMTEKSTYISKEDIEKRIIYVGDASVDNIKNSVTNSNVTYITDINANYEWLINTANSELENVLTNKPNAIIVFSIGVNDPTNIDNYIAYYNQLKTKYSGIKIYFISLQNDSSNQEILAFNEKLSTNYSENYMDISNIESSQIHNNIISSIRRSMGGDLIQKLEELGNWYIENVNTYTCQTSGKFKNCRKKYENPFTERAYADDCTEFAAAYMAYVCGSDIPESYSGGMVDPNGSWGGQVSALGWKGYSSDEISSLEPGDVLIAHAGSLYSKKGHHAEIYINESETFGWGTIKKKYPTNNSIVRKEYGGHVHYEDSGHDYITIYRYEG